MAVDHTSVGRGWGETIDIVRETVRQFTINEVAPRAAEIDETNEFPRDLSPMLGEHGLLGMTVPEALGLSLIHISEQTRPERLSNDVI